MLRPEEMTAGVSTSTTACRRTSAPRPHLRAELGQAGAVDLIGPKIRMPKAFSGREGAHVEHPYSMPYEHFNSMWPLTDAWPKVKNWG
jgi:hypothetical protein